MYDTIAPHCSGRILEIGSGIGNISRYFLEEGRDIVLSDIRLQYCTQLESQFPGTSVIQIDLVDEKFEDKYQKYLSSFDTVFALNVIEHIENDELAMRNIRKLLRPGGACVILVPAFQFLYNKFDENLLHFRRYNHRSLGKLMESSFNLTRTFYFNPVGILGWYVNGTILGKSEIPGDQMKAFDIVVPVFRLINWFTRKLFGLSVIAVGKK